MGRHIMFPDKKQVMKYVACTLKLPTLQSSIKVYLRTLTDKERRTLAYSKHIVIAENPTG